MLPKKSIFAELCYQNNTTQNFSPIEFRKFLNFDKVCYANNTHKTMRNIDFFYMGAGVDLFVVFTWKALKKHKNKQFQHLQYLLIRSHQGQVVLTNLYFYSIK